MTVTQTQAIDEAYTCYCTLFNDGISTRDEQEAQFAKYERLCEQEALQAAWDALQATPAYVEHSRA